MKKSLCLLFVLPFVAGCGYNKSRKVEQSLVRDTLITELSDSSLFGRNISCLSCLPDGIYFSDYSEGNVVVLDKNLHLQHKVGKHGDGPDEVVGVVHFVRSKSNFYLLDEGSRSIKEYASSGEYLSTTTIPRDILYAPWGRFLYLDSLFYLPNIKGFVASVVDRNGKLVKQFGENQGEEVGGRVMLYDGKANIWAIGIAAPIVEKYTKDGKLLKSLDYGEMQIVKEIRKKSRNSGNSFTAIINDAYLDNGKLYILIMHKVLCFSLDGNIQLEKVYLLPHGFYSSIGVENDKLYGINTRNVSIERFTMN